MRSSLLALGTVCVAVTAAAPAASAQTGDSVTGRAQVRTSATTVLDVSFDAHSGLSGEQPTGTVTDNGAGIEATIRCLNVVGNQAVIVATGTAFQTLIFVEDNNGAGQDRFGYGSLFPRPPITVCPDPGSIATSPLSFGPARIASGDIVVRDAPALPTTKDQCKDGGFRSYGSTFKNQGQCIAFVQRGTKLPS